MSVIRVDKTTLSIENPDLTILVTIDDELYEVAKELSKMEYVLSEIDYYLSHDIVVKYLS